MDLVKEILRLPNFYYEYLGNDGRVHMAVLGGCSCRTTDKIESREACSEYFCRMELIYEKEKLTDDDKRNLAKYMQRIQTLCDSRREGLHSLKEQADYLNGLQEEETKQLEIQVRMYKDSRQYYRDYIYRTR